jgi:hypothetical protein
MNVLISSKNTSQSYSQNLIKPGNFARFNKVLTVSNALLESLQFHLLVLVGLCSSLEYSHIVNH